MKVIKYFKEFLYPTPKQTCMNCNKEKKKLSILEYAVI